MNNIFLIIILLGGLCFAQVSADLTIENQQAVGTDFFFDIYLTRTGTNNVYLGTADFVLTFNAANFNSPVLSKEPAAAPGLCTFVPTNQTFPYPLLTQINYFNSTSLEILNGNELVINLDGPAPGDVAAFNTSVARIDNTPSTHSLGRFKVSGITNTVGFMNLHWKRSGTGITTQVFTLDPNDLTAPIFESSLVTLNAIDPANAPLPVELTSFTATTKNNIVTLQWKTATETNNYGFEVERCVLSAEPQAWNKIGFVSGNGNSNSPKDYSFKDNNLFGGGSKFLYRLKQIDNDGKYEYSEIVEVEVVPQQFELSQNYPNPFNPVTSFRFSLPVQIQLKINIYNMLGELVKTVSDGLYEAGFYTIAFDASELSSGTYIYRLESKDFVETRKMILIK